MEGSSRQSLLRRSWNSRVFQGGTRWGESYGYKLSLLYRDLEVVIAVRRDGVGGTHRATRGQGEDSSSSLPRSEVIIAQGYAAVLVRA